ncbi:MAG: hypothetical protein M3167_17555 [Acidobacteriota bacterium]|nr:hypothetical protein [Acidobacteriota bacterium]
MLVQSRRTRNAIRAALFALCAACVPLAARAGLNEWTSIGPYGPGGNVRSLAIDPAVSGTLYAGTDGGIFKSVDSGVTWGPVKAGLTSFTVYALALDPSAHETVYAGTNGGVFKSVNAGASWTARRTGLGKIAVLTLAIDPSDSSTLYAGTATAGVFKSTDRGSTWGAMNNGLPQTEIRSLAVAPAPSGTIFAATSGGVYRSADAARTWNPAPGFAASVRTVAVDPLTPSIVYAGTEGVFTTSGVFKSMDGGASWAPMNTGLGNATVLSVAASPTVAGMVFLGTQGGGVFVTTNAGATWRGLVGSPETVNDVVLDPAGAAVFAGGTTGFFRSPDQGRTWAGSNVSFSTFTVNGLVMDPSSSNILYAGVGRPGTTGGGVYKTTNAGGTWAPASNGLPDRTVQALVIDTGFPATIYAGTNGGGIYRSRDGGATWSSANAGLTSTVVLSIAVGRSGIVYAGTGDGVFRSPDAGLTWTAASGGLSDRSVLALAVDPGASDVVYAGTASGVFKTSDGGRNWTATNFGNRGVLSLAVDPANSAVVYAGTFSSVNPGSLTGYGVYKSTDAGASWAAANGGIEGLAILTLAADPAGGLFAGTGKGVFRSASGAGTWTGVNEGLSDEVVSSILVDPRTPTTVYAGAVNDSVFKISFASGSGACTTGPTTLCLNGNRFSVQVAWRAINVGTAGAGTAVPLTSDTGSFWFFTSGNIELVVKVVDGRAYNGAFWVFYGALSDVSYTITVTDTLTNVRKTYENSQGRLASVADTSAFPGAIASAAFPLGRGSAGAASAPPGGASVWAAPANRQAAAGPCVADATSLCLNGDRFRVQVNWFAANIGSSGAGQTVPLSSDSGSFWFFSPGNLELIVKVVDGRAVTGHFWVFYGALSDVEYTITVTDTQTGTSRTYSNPQGRLASVADTSAF